MVHGIVIRKRIEHYRLASIIIYHCLKLAHYKMKSKNDYSESISLYTEMNKKVYFGNIFFF